MSEATIAAGLRAARRRLAQAGADSPDIDARRLLAAVLEVTESYLWIHGERELRADEQASFEALLARRLAGEPLAYILGEAGFWSLDLAVDSATLIPRPDTETLVAAVLERAAADAPLSVLDLGTGSGAIALALARERPAWRVTATERSRAALACARANAERLGLTRVTFIESDWYTDLVSRRFDVVVSNPPYVAAGDPHLAAAALGYEPAAALVAGDQGLADLRTLAAGAGAHLRPGGLFALEHGADQGPAVRALLYEARLVAIETLHDLGRNERVTLGYRPTD